MKIIRLTDAESGRDIYINPKYLESVFEDRGDRGIFNSLVNMQSGERFSVRQKIEDIRAKIYEANP